MGVVALVGVVLDDSMPSVEGQVAGGFGSRLLGERLALSASPLAMAT